MYINAGKTCLHEYRINIRKIISPQSIGMKSKFLEWRSEVQQFLKTVD